MVKKINDILNINIKPYDIFADENESNSFMLSAKQVIYDFIPNDENLIKIMDFVIVTYLCHYIKIKLRA